MLLLLILLNPSLAAAACDDEDDDGLDVALVLSGGGALATTHIGAIELIESLGIPIHCVVGTSMGSVVGALYAYGYRAAELESIFRDSRWPEIFAGTVSRVDEPYLRKEQDALYFSGYIAGMDGQGMHLPGGFRHMGGLRTFYRQLLEDVPVQSDFDALPIPYRSVATDLADGQAVVLSEGDLVEAMLASMAVPGVFAPREIGGRMLVDGGLAQQLPVQAARAMGADLIIALDTTVEPPSPAPDWSAAQVAQQLIRLTVWQNWQVSARELGERDVLIRPDLNGLSTSSFGLAEVGFQSGRAEAERYRDALIRIRELAAPARERRDPRTTPSPSKLVVDNRTVLNETLIERRFGYQPDDFAKPERTKGKLDDLVAFGGLEEADLAYVDEDTARLSARPLTIGRNLLSAGFRASNNLEGDSTYEVRGRFTRRPFSGSGSELRVSAEVGTDVGVLLQYYHPWGSESRFFLEPSVGYTGEQILLDFESERLGVFWRQTAEAQLRLGRELGDWGVLGVDAIANASRIETQVAISPLGIDKDRFLGVGAFFGLDTLDRTDWPERGWQLQSEFQWLQEQESHGDSDRYRFRLLKPLMIGGFGLLLKAESELVDNEADNPTTALRLGGFRRLTAYGENSLISDDYQIASVELYRRLNPSTALISVPLYVGALVEYGNVHLELLGQDFGGETVSYSAYLGVDTALGPLFFGGGASSESATLFLHFGRSF